MLLENLVDSKLYCIFAARKKQEVIGGLIMLGVNSPREPITPEFSRKIWEALWRATTGNLNADEKEFLRKEREVSKKVRIVWK